MIKSWFLLSLLFQSLLLWYNVFSVDCSTAKSQSACSAITGCKWVVATNACQCDSSLLMDVCFSMDASGSIGSTGFVQEKSFVASMISSGLPSTSNISIIEFATTSAILLNFAQTKAYNTTALVNYVNAIPYTKGNTNTVAALKDGLTVFNYTTTRTKYYMLITDGNPNLPGGDIDVCAWADDYKTAGIVVIIIGVGSALDFTIVDCLVTDDKYLIKVEDFSSFSDITGQLGALICPVTYSLVITEVAIEKDDTNTGERFIEIYNPGSDVTLANLKLEGFFTGVITTNGSEILKQGQYLVLYDSSSKVPNCTDCTSCTLNSVKQCTNAKYISCSSSSSTGCAVTIDTSMTNSNWKQGLVDKTDLSLVDLVQFVNGSSWPSVLKGYTFELKNKGYGNDVGGNWQQSCNTLGTPGADPITTCSCVSPTACRSGGDTSATCGAGGTGCSCSSGFYSTGSSCYQVPPPRDCYAYEKKNGSITYLSYIWQKASTDVAITYRLTYSTGPISTDTGTQNTGSRQIDRYNPYLPANKTGWTPGYVQTNLNGQYSVEVQCVYVTPEPTLAPTPRPTDYPRVWISGDICANDRCDCADQSYTCDCLNEKDTFHCNRTAVSKEFAEANENQFLTFKTWPSGFSEPFQVCWKITPQSATSSATIKRRLQSANMTDDDDTTTPSPGTTSSSSGKADYSDITPYEGCLDFTQDNEEKITIVIKQDGVGADANYEQFLLQIVNCSHPTMDCDIIWPSTLFMEVEDSFYAASLLEGSSKKGTPTWVWWLLAGLLLLLALIAAMAYRWFVKNKRTEGKLAKTADELEKEKEENELGFGHDLGQGDVGFNPLATGVPGTSHPSGGLTAEMENRQAIQQVNVDAPSEKFQHRMEYGQHIPDKRRQ